MPGFRPRKTILEGTERRWVCHELQEKSNEINVARAQKAWRSRKRLKQARNI